MDEIRIEISTLKIPYEHSLVPIYPDLTFNKDDACFLFETLSSFALFANSFYFLAIHFHALTPHLPVLEFLPPEL